MPRRVVKMNGKLENILLFVEVYCPTTSMPFNCSFFTMTETLITPHKASILLKVLKVEARQITRLFATFGAILIRRIKSDRKASRERSLRNNG